MWNKIKEVFHKKEATEKSDKWIFGTMLVFGIIALLASFVLTIEEFHLLKNPDAQLSCSINLVLNCATVMQTWQASVLGFPNMLIGLIAFPTVIMTAALGLSRTKLPRWFWQAASIGFFFSMLFAQWLFFQSLYDIGTLCPWCLTVTASTVVIFATIAHYVVRENVFNFSKKTHQDLLKLQEKDYGKLITVAWLALLVVLVFIKYGDSLFA